MWIEQPHDFVMCAHIFGGTSSASYSNFALKRTAVDNESIFGKDASEVLKKVFFQMTFSSLQKMWNLQKN